MALGTRLVCAAGAIGAALVVANPAAAQTISASSQLNPTRIINGQVVTATRPLNLNPFGVNFADCAADMTLEFSVIVSGFTGADTLQVWASNAGDCTASASRGVASVPTCWMVSQGVPGLVSSAAMTETFDIKVRDIVGPQNAIPNPAGFAQTQTHGELLGTAACTTQPSFLGVPMFITFVAVDGMGNAAGQAYVYGSSQNTTAAGQTGTATGTFITDMIGPPAPSGVTESVGDKLFNVNWTPNVDSDTAGYNIFIDPIPGHEGAAPGAATSAPSAPVLVCSGAGAGAAADGGLDESGVADASDEGGAATDATATVPDAGPDACVYVTTAGPPATPGAGGGGTCADPILASGIVQDGGSASVPIVNDEAGLDVEAGVAETGNGGVSTIPCANQVGGSCDPSNPASFNPSVSSNSQNTYTITGLQNGVTYNVVVAAVDGSGNVGPPSAEVCDFPAPVNDFWNVYRQDGGGAGGSLCSVSAAGRAAPATGGLALLAGSGAFALRRRRRRRAPRAGR